MENDEKILTYLNRVKRIAATLKSMSVTIDNEELGMTSRNGLPSTYESLIVALDALGTDAKTFNFDLVKSRLLHEEQRTQEREGALLHLHIRLLFLEPAALIIASSKKVVASSLLGWGARTVIDSGIQLATVGGET